MSGGDPVRRASRAAEDPSPEEWRALADPAVAPAERRVLREDLHFRAAWHDARTLLGPGAADAVRDLALLCLKPDAVVGRRGARILAFLEEHGGTPVAAAPIRFERRATYELWRNDWVVYPVDRLAFCRFWYEAAEGLLLLVHMPARGAVSAARRLSAVKGSSLPRARRPTDLRTRLEPPNQVLNFVHVADHPGDVLRELSILLDPPARRAALGEAAAQVRPEAARARVRAALEAVEARNPRHDLLFAPALERLLASPAGPILEAEVFARRPALRAGRAAAGLAGDEGVPWWTFEAAIAGATLDHRARWDVVVVASELVAYEHADALQP
ncbi:hypothetical protein [Salinarimonas sp.]|uniref:hypothetical protein n=1 Tax=Salinarimonas sp. TaxID=2766526 RepID=UPI0032D90173